MAAPVINNLLLPGRRILVSPDGPDPEEATTGVIYRRSSKGGGHFTGQPAGEAVSVSSGHVLFVREMTTEVVVGGTEYLAMHENAVVGLVPE